MLHLQHRVKAHLTAIQEHNLISTLLLMTAIPMLLAALNRLPVTSLYAMPLIGIYLPKFTHFATVYMLSNIFMYLFFLSGAYLLGRNSRLFIPTIIIFLIGYPLFDFSLTYPLFGPLDSRGFSGIVYAIYGYLVWLTIKAVKHRAQNPSLGLFMEIALLLFAALPLLGPQIISTGNGVAIINHWSHYTGFLFGLIVPTVLAWRWEPEFKQTKKGWKIGLFMIIVTVLLV